MKKTTVPQGYWEDADDYDSEDWCYAVMTGSTRLGYWQWVEQQRTQQHHNELPQARV
jgi:hypothetical protein